MARRTLNRHKLRVEADLAAQTEASGPDAPAAAAEAAPPAAPGKKPRKAPAAKKPAAPRKQARPKVPPRMRARWGMFDAGMKQVAVFDYNRRATAEAALAEIIVRKKALHVLQLVKEPMPEPAVPAV